MITPALGVDVGTVRVGLAGSDETGVIATPLRTVPRQPAARLWREVREVVEERLPACIVVGLPRRLDGSEGESAADARAVADQLHKRTGLPVEMWDERFTTAAAERSLIAAGQRRAQRRRSVDAVAATLLLQSWLDYRANTLLRR
ncbi:MAG: Holliday junction resolvase RuvX [Candidatus Dormibacteraeota bacterium]|uniref:Putative pre-16S rRNA nuclease n=1 Tax=Candidatus Aeolococcus gillhamiae TaxID=3127015 RepID=A0A934JXY0_9BACT|nr:Holliday junction resolvase RuvX [Candidatus Dormibacteraeota bacterium]